MEWFWCQVGKPVNNNNQQFSSLWKIFESQVHCTMMTEGGVGEMETISVGKATSIISFSAIFDTIFKSHCFSYRRCILISKRFDRWEALALERKIRSSYHTRICVCYVLAIYIWYLNAKTEEGIVVNCDDIGIIMSPMRGCLISKLHDTWFQWFQCVPEYDDQDRISSYKINTTSRRQVMRINKSIN